MRSSGPAPAPQVTQRGRFTSWPLLVLIVVWVVAAFTYLRATSIVEDWNGWRQADTQTIALNLAAPGGRLLYPRVAWGGAGPGYVETELQLYPACFAPLLTRYGNVEWPGQILSIACVAGAAIAMYVVLRPRFGQRAACAGSAALLASRGVMHFGTAVQPEALCLLLYVLGWLAILRYASSGARSALILYGTFGTLAMLVKPSAAQLGISSVLLLGISARERLRSVRSWVTWALMLGVFFAYLWHAKSLYEAHGNSFGVLGGESKFPRLEHLLMPGLYVSALRNWITWGAGYVGAGAAVALLLLRRFGVVEGALLTGNMVWLIVSLRYSAHPDWGTHYPALGSVFGAWCVAHLWTAIGLRLNSLLAALRFALAAVLLAQLGVHFELRRRATAPSSETRSVISMARALQPLVKPGDLIVVRANAFSYDQFWRTRSNYEDPRIFYLTRTKGWALGLDQNDPYLLARYTLQGARYFVELGEQRGGAFGQWLERNGSVALTNESGTIWRLTGSF